MLRLAPLVTVAALAVGCATPATDTIDYRNKVAHSAASMRGIVASAILAVELDEQGRMLASLTDNVVTDAEDDAQSVLTALDSRQPPNSASVSLKNEADTPLQDAANTLTDLRVALRRGDHAGVKSAIDDLTKTSNALDRLQAIQ
jgi:hypothetical protein